MENRKALLISILIIPLTPHWGFLAHEQINYLAVFTLPPELFGFYKANIEYLRKNSGNPDKRRMLVEGEAARHYIDVDHYELEPPLDTIRLTWDSACSRFGREQIEEHGIAPWNILRLKYALSVAFRKKNYADILRISADLGHYVGDIHVPLHANSNYDGQKTGQHGIHALWESRLPELFLSEYHLITGKAQYLNNTASALWDVIEESYSLSKFVLSGEKQLREELGEEKMFATDIRNGNPFRTYSLLFRKRYHKIMEGMVEKRMREAIYLTGCIWFSAWVDAGQPDLPVVVPESIPVGADSLNGKQTSGLFRKSLFLKSCESDSL